MNNEALKVAVRAADEVMIELEMVARNPIQGEAMHKVMGWSVLEALEDAGWVKTPDSER